MQAIILAAGMGKRLKEYTQNNTKCMVKVCGETLIERMLRQLEQRDFSKVILVIGYRGKELKEFVEGLQINGYDVTVCDPPLAGYREISDLSIYDDYPEIDTHITMGAYTMKGIILNLPKIIRRTLPLRSPIRC